MKIGKPTRFKSKREKNTGYTSPSRPSIVFDSSPLTAEETKNDHDDLCVFLDDERPCPEGWTLVKSHFDFFRLLRDKKTRGKITRLSLDCNLGIGCPDGVFVAKHLVEDIKGYAEYMEDPYFPNLKSVNFHSSDRDSAIRMAKYFDDLPAEMNIRLRLGLPS